MESSVDGEYADGKLAGAGDREEDDLTLLTVGGRAVERENME